MMDSVMVVDMPSAPSLSTVQRLALLVPTD